MLGRQRWGGERTSRPDRLGVHGPSGVESRSQGRPQAPLHARHEAGMPEEGWMGCKLRWRGRQGGERGRGVRQVGRDHGGVGGGQLLAGLDCPAGMGSALHMGPVILGTGGGDTAEGAMKSRRQVTARARGLLDAWLRGTLGAHASVCPPLLARLHASSMHVAGPLAVQCRLLAVRMISEHAARGWLAVRSLAGLSMTLLGTGLMGIALI